METVEGVTVALRSRLVLGDGAHLILNGFNMIAGGTAVPVIHVQDTGTITLEGDNRLIGAAPDSAAVQAGTDGEGIVAFNGSGNLLLRGGGSGSEAYAAGVRGNLALAESVTITAYGALGNSPGAGVFVADNGTVALSGDAELVAYGGNAPIFSAEDGIYGRGLSVTVTERAKLSAVGGFCASTYGGGNGLHGSLQIHDDAEVYIAAGKSGNTAVRHGILDYDRDASVDPPLVTATGGTLVVHGGYSDGRAQGGNAINGAVAISGDAVVTAVGGDSTGGAGGYGIFSDAASTINGATVTALGGTGKTTGGAGIESGDAEIAIGGGAVVTATGGVGETAGGNGVYSAIGTLRVDGHAQLRATGGASSVGPGGHGIDAALTIANQGAVIAAAGQSTALSYTPYAVNKTVQIDSGSLSATGTTYPDGASEALLLKPAQNLRYIVHAGESAPGSAVTDQSTDFHLQHYVHILRKPGTVTADSVVGIDDLIEIANANNYNKVTSAASNPNTDVNSDGKVNFADLALTRNSQNFGG